jgi:hypothetical protein
LSDAENGQEMRSGMILRHRLDGAKNVIPFREALPMGVPPDNRPPRWTDVDRTTLIRLLVSRLTPDQVGALYGRSGSHVRTAARAWGLGPGLSRIARPRSRPESYAR